MKNTKPGSPLTQAQLDRNLRRAVRNACKVALKILTPPKRTKAEARRFKNRDRLLRDVRSALSDALTPPQRQKGRAVR